MANILVIFGSKSDEKTYSSIIKTLKEIKLGYKLEICSAHKDPKKLDKIIKNTKADLIIAGAGLSAALPGVIASKTIKPVIGVPVDANLNGLDALLSIMQMPPGIPVLAVGINWPRCHCTGKLFEKFRGATIIGDKNNEALKKCAETLGEFNIRYEFSNKPKNESINIYFFELDRFRKFESSNCIINVPLKDNSKAEDALKLLKLTDVGFWVGLNNGKNAALAAVEILNKDGKYTEKLNLFREGLKKK